MEEELVQQKSILLDSLTILERSAEICGSEVKPEVWEKQLDEVYNRYFDIVARLEVMTSIDLKLERMEFDGKYYRLSAHILSSLALPPLPTLPCDPAAKPVAPKQAAPPHGGSSTVVSLADVTPLPPQHSSCSRSTTFSLVPVAPKQEAQPASGSSAAHATRRSDKLHRKLKPSKSAEPKRTNPGSSGSSAAGSTTDPPQSSRAKPSTKPVAPKQAIPAQASSRSKLTPKPVAPTAKAPEKQSSSSSVVVSSDQTLMKPCFEGDSSHLRLTPDNRKPLSQRTDPVSQAIPCPICMRSRVKPSRYCSGTHCRSCCPTHESHIYTNHSLFAPSGRSTVFGQKQRNVSWHSRPTSRPVQQEHPARCLLDNAPRVLPRVPSKREELPLQPKDNRHSTTHSHRIKLPRKHYAERAQLGHVREVGRAKADALPQCVLPRQPMDSTSPAPTFSAGFEDSCRSESDLFKAVPGCSTQDNPSAISCTRLHPLPVCADITRMFRQILVRPTDQLFPRIWWRDSPDPSLEVFELSTVAHGVSNTSFQLNPETQPLQFPLALPVSRRASAEDHGNGSDEDSPLNTSCEPTSSGVPVRRPTVELRETSLLRDLFRIPSAAVGLYMATYKLLQLPIRRTQIGRIQPVPEEALRDRQKIEGCFYGAQKVRILTRQIIRCRRFRHMGGIGPPQVSESHPRQAYQRRTHGLSMAAGQLNLAELAAQHFFTHRVLKQHTKQKKSSQPIAQHAHARTMRRLLHPPLLYGTICDGGRLLSTRTLIEGPKRAEMRNNSQLIALHVHQRTKLRVLHPPLLYDTFCDGGRLDVIRRTSEGHNEMFLTHLQATATYSGPIAAGNASPSIDFGDVTPSPDLKKRRSGYCGQRERRDDPASCFRSLPAPGGDINQRIYTPVEWTPGLARGTSCRREIRSSRVNSWPRTGKEPPARDPVHTLGKSRQSRGLLAQARGNRARSWYICKEEQGLAVWVLWTPRLGLDYRQVPIVFPLYQTYSRPSFPASTTSPEGCCTTTHRSTRTVDSTSCVRGASLLSPKASSRGSGRQTGPRD